MEFETEIEIKGLGGNSIIIRPIGLINYNSDLDWDRNWVKTKIICNDQPGLYSSQLKYEVHFDQTYIKDWVRKINEVTKIFPITGDFNKNNYNI
ncbi:MAG TPA: hypothetical protein PKA53_08545 [Sphingobacterium sp.]|nr:hypothetical protein [Sphingobacterium sp.]